MSGTPVTLERAVSRWEIVALAINDVVGSGIYLLPAAAAAILAGASLWAVALAGLAVILIVLCFAEAASYFDGPGSAYLYARAAFGDFVGFEVGWMTWLARVASVASLSVGFAQALSYFWPAASSGLGRVLVVLLPLLGLTWINVIGVKAGVRAAVFFVIAKLAPLGLFLVFGVAAAFRSSPPEHVVSEPGGLTGAALLLLYAYAGFENTPAPAGEFRRPRRDVPFALIVHLVLVTLLYVGVQWVALRTLPGLGESETPLADAARSFMGPWGGAILTFGAAVSILGTNSNTVLAGPRYLFALAKDGYGPRYLAAIHPRFRTPAAAVVTQTLLAIPLALTGSFVGLAALSVVARLATYLGTAAAIPVLRRKAALNQPAAPLGEGGGTGGLSLEPRAAAQGGFRLPGGPVIPILASVLTVGLAASASKWNLIAGAVALGVGAALYTLRRPRPAE